VANPNVKKDANGNYVIVGFEGNNFTKQQLDYIDIQQQAEVLNGPKGDELRNTISLNPSASAGVISGLYKNGTIGSSELVKTFADIDSQTKADREKQALLKSQEEANANFKKQLFGVPYNVWKALKGVTRTTFTAAFAPVEGIINSLGNIVGSQVTGAKGDAVWEGYDSTYAVQSLKQFIQEGKIDIGEGFFPNEESGVGFRVREEKLKFGKIKVLDGEGNQVLDKEGNPLYRPYSPVDPISYYMTGGNLEGGTARLINAVGEIGLMIYADPLTKVSKARKAYNQIKKSEAYVNGRASAEQLQKLTILETQMINEADDVSKALDDLNLLERAENAGVPVADSEFIKFQKAYNDAVAKKLKLDTETQGVQKGVHYDALETYLNGRSAKPILEEIAQIRNPIRLIEYSKRSGGEGFTYTQASALARASTKEEVANVLAGYIAQGQVVQSILESGTAVSRGLSKMYKGPAVIPARAVTGWAAKGMKKLPQAEKLYGALSRSWNNYIPKQGTLVHYNDKDAVAETILGFGKTFNVDEKILVKLIDDVVYSVNPRDNAYKAATRVFDEVFNANAAAFEKAGIPTTELKRLTRFFADESEKQSIFWAERHGKGIDGVGGVEYIRSKGESVILSGPHLESERLNSMLYFPPPAELLGEIARIGKLNKVVGYKGKYSGAVLDKVDAFTSNYWKRVILTRPAYIIRNIGEEQIRMMLSGNISFYNNPMAAIGMMIGKDNGTAFQRLLNSQDQWKNNVFGKSIKEPPANQLANETIAVESKNSYQANMLDTSNLSRGEINKIAATTGYALVYKSDPRWWSGLANDIIKLGSDTWAKLAVNTRVGEEANTVNRLLYGEGKPGWDRFLNGVSNPKTKEFFSTPEGVMAYLFTGVNSEKQLTGLRARVRLAAGGDGPAAETIIKLISDGAIETAGYSIKIPKAVDFAENSIKNSKQVAAGKKATKDSTEEFAEQLKKYFDGAGDWEKVGYQVPERIGVTNSKVLNFLTEKSDGFFDISVKWQKIAGMGPEWRQKYWEAVTDVIYAADSVALTSIKTAAPKSLNNLLNADGKRKIGLEHVFWGQAKKAKGEGTMTLDEIHLYAEKVATSHVKDLFYDASKRRLLWHQLRLVAPFGQAWENTISKWGELAFNNPAQVYKVARGLNFLSSPKSSALYEITDAKSYYDPNQGFFFNDSRSGDRQFFIPFMASGMNFMTNLITKGELSTSGPQGAKGSPQSFNFALGTGVFPGFGPGITLSVSTLNALGVDVLSPLPFDVRVRVEKILFPFGRPNLKTPDGIVASLTTNNISRISSSFLGWEESYASSFGPVMNYLASGGDYNLDTVEDQNRLTKDTDRFAKWFGLSRGLFGMVSPVAIMPEDLVKDKSGNTLLAAALYNDFKELEKNAGGDKQKAYADFLDLYGPEQIFALIGTWTGKDGNFAPPDNLYTYKLLLENPGIDKEYADIYGYLYPNGGLSMQLKKWNELSGKSQRLTTQQIVERATQIRYSAAKDRLLTRSVAEGWSSKYESAAISSLRDSFVTIGLKQDTFDFTRDDRTLNQLRRAAQDKRFLDSESVAGIRDYLALRDKVLEVNGKKPNDSLKTKGFESQRTFLAEQALEIIKRNPEFQKIFYAFFRYELVVE
jgi:hypothetical protein